jgi:hypothetical protein
MRLVGDLFFVHDAPLAAIRAYKRSFRYARADEQALAEMGDLNFAIGQISRARSYYMRAASMMCADGCLPSAVEYLDEIENGASPFTPLYVSGDRGWAASELLAASRAHRVLPLLRGASSTRLRQCRAMALGVMGDINGFLTEWTEISKHRGRIRMTDKDWFYLPPVTWDSAEFWHLLIRSSPRIDRLGLWFQGLPGDLAAASGNNKIPARRLRSELRRRRGILEFHLARAERNLPALRRLHQEYPAWTEVTDLLSVLRDAPETLTPLPARYKGLATLTTPAWREKIDYAR